MESYSAIKKGYIWVNSNEVDKPRIYYTEWSKSEKERQILYINNIYGIYKDGTDDPTHSAVKKMQTYDHLGEGEGGMIWESSIETYTLPCVK